MTIDEEDAAIIVAMAEVCAGEGIGPPFEDLLDRILEEYPDVPITKWIDPRRDS